MDPRRVTVATSKFHPVSLNEAGPRAQHQRRPVMEGSAIPKRRSRSSSVRELLLLILIPALIVVLARVFVADLYVIPSGSMMNTLQINDRIITSKLSPKIFQLKRGDVIVFKDPANWLGSESEGSSLFSSEYLVKRLIGLPGDHVKCCTAGGQITINGVAIDETSYIRPGVEPSTIPFDITVMKDHLFVLGDNRSNSADSRYHANDGAEGLVPVSDVAGVAKFVYWPLSHFTHLSRPDSVFAKVPDAQ
jgi:signal peptidase I